MRISVQEAKKLGLLMPEKKKSASLKKKDSLNGEKDRALKTDYGASEVVIDISLSSDPQPKERPRTVVDTDAIMSAYHQSRGSGEKFRELIRKRLAKTYTPKNTTDYEKMIAAEAMSAMAKARMKPFDCPVETHIHIVFKGDETTWPTSPVDGDVDNLEKAILDALNKIVYTDDRLVVTSYRQKSCGPEAKVTVRVRPASCHKTEAK